MARLVEWTRGKTWLWSTRVRSRESLFVNAKLNGNDVRIMVDTSATHNFVKEKRDKDLCWNYVASDTLLKTVNALPITVHGFALKVPIDLGGWKGLTQFHLWMCLTLFWGWIFIMRLTYLFRRFSTNFTSAMSKIVKGFKKGDLTFLAALVRGVKNSIEAVDLPPCIEQVLVDNRD
ncbi:hypothetical protein H5410_005764, partial [Solanum commersonii]